VSDERGARAEGAATALEVAVADAGALLLRAERYRLGTGPAIAALSRAVRDVGDEARALHRRGRLDADAAQALLAHARGLVGRIEALLARIRDAPEYVDAVAAHRAGNREALLRLLPAVFADLEAAPVPPRLFQALDWRRRGRPRPVADLVAEVLRARDRGLAAEGDDLSRGADALLPAVVLVNAPPADEPIALCVDTARVGPRVLRVADTGEYLVHGPPLLALAGVHLAAALSEDELEANPADYGRLREELARGLRDAGVPVISPSRRGAGS
jgi:hypothetical protein